VWDFSEALRPSTPENDEGERKSLEAKFLEDIASMPTFHEIYDEGTLDGYYCPQTVVVLSNAGTFSAAYTMMSDLHQVGAVIVGTPSGQAGQAFGSSMIFRLAHSNLSGLVAQMCFAGPFLDKKPATILRPQHLLTYEKFASYDFDRNAEILLALELYGPDAGR